MKEIKPVDKIIVDGNLLAFRNFFGQRDLSFDGKGTGLPYGFLLSLLTIREEYDGRFYIAWDMGRDLRTEIYPEYKANRGKSMTEEEYNDFKRQKKIVQRLLRNLGILQVTKRGVEGDDICATLARKFVSQKKLIVTSDHDLFQLLNDDTFVLRASRDGYRLLGAHRFEKEFGITSSLYVFVLALTGDKGDNIPGVSGIGLKRAATIVNDNPESFPRFVAGDDEVELIGNEKLIQKVYDNADVIRRAYTLVELYTIERMLFERGALNERVVKNIFAKLGFVEFRKRKKFQSIIELKGD